MSSMKKGLHRQASRLAQNESLPSTTSSGAWKILRTGPFKILAVHQWKRMVNLVTTLLQFIQVKSFLLQIMPSDTIDPSSSDSEYEKIPVPGQAPKKEEKGEPWRALKHNGVSYLIGPSMGPGQGVKDKLKITHDPALCQHPSDKMCARGGRNDQRWWHCQACGNRFRRIPLSSYVSAGSVATGPEIIAFGKHMGKTCNTVYEKHPEYCLWVIATSESGDDACQQLHKFAKYIVDRGIPDAEDIPAGALDEEL
jgi:hypothetical protein